MRFVNKITLLLTALLTISGFIQFLAFDRIFLSTANTLLLTTNEKAAKNIGETLASYFAKATDAVKTVASDPSLRQDKTALDKVNSLIPEINMLFVLDRQGNVVGSTGDNTNANFSQRGYFLRAMRGETLISNVFTSTANRQVVAIAAPIRENDQISGVVVATVWLHESYLAAMFDDKPFGRNGATMIADAQGVVVYHLDKSRIGQKAAVFDSLPEPAGSVTMPNDTGEEQYTGYYTLPSTHWFVAVQTPTSELKGLRRLMIYQTFAVSFITILLAVGIGIYALRRYMKPFEKLVNAFSFVRKGTYRELTPGDYDSEFGEIMQAYNLTVKKLEGLHNSLRGAADIDGLTGTYNRRAFEQAASGLSKELQAGTLKHLGILFIDLDNFKAINDKQGHVAGDDVLRDFALLAKSVIEPRSLFRYGGDEFVIVLRELPLGTIAALAEEIRVLSEQQLRGCTTSIGIATYPENSSSMDQLLVFADKALYTSKSVKNTVTVYTA